MNRAVLLLIAGTGALGIAACGSAAAGTTAPKASATPSAGARRLGNAAAGQLVQINGQTLILSNANGDTTVAYTSSTTISQTSTATFADITTGVCMTATGTKDSSGHVTASSVTVRNAANGSCAGSAIFGGPGGPGGPNAGTRTPNPNRTPPPQAANIGRANGMVTAVNGTSVTVQPATGASVTVTVPTTVRVSKTDTVGASALQTGECVAAVGSTNSAKVVQARSLTIVPAGPSGCFTGAGGGFFGGRGGGGGGGGGGFPGGGGGFPGGGAVGT
ncbi:MAG TPA: hypothetical protein VF155_00730 [Candidatus Dormibacteraeota bacterium]